MECRFFLKKLEAKEGALAKEPLGIQCQFGAGHGPHALKAIHGHQKVALNLAYAMLGRDGAAHSRDLFGPKRQQVFGLMPLGLVVRQQVHMEVIVANVAPSSALKARRLDGRAIELHDLAQLARGTLMSLPTLVTAGSLAR